MIQLIRVLLSPKTPYTLTYMLQQSDYSNHLLLRWLLHNPTLKNAQKRGDLVLTSRAKISLLASYIGWSIPLILGLALLHLNLWVSLLVLLMSFASLVAILLTNATIQPVVERKFKKEVYRARIKLSNMNAIKIAVIGSYGKTTTKEILATILSTEKKVAATPKNKNVLISHARWINNLNGNEEILIFEYGEARPGDIAKMAELSQPDIAIITGVAPAHMEDYGSLDAIAKDFATIIDYTKQSVYINADSLLLKQYVQESKTYNANHADQWLIKDVAQTITSTSFRMQKNKTQLGLSSKLIGGHLVGSLGLCVAIAHRLGMQPESIIDGVAKTKPFEHRMQPYKLSGAWVIDDTYNGNIEGMRAGLTLLKEFQAKRKIYVTPGLVEQGSEAVAVHKELGGLIANADPDKVVLMQNSVLPYIKQGLSDHKYDGDVTVIDDSLTFYQNLQFFVASGDLVLMQNDWPDNYH